MAESDLNDTRGPSGNQLELQPFQNLGLGDTIDPSDNPLALQPFQNLGSGQLDIVRELGRQGANVQLHFHQNNDNKTVIKGDLVQGSKTDVKDSAIQTLTLPTEDSSNQGHLQSQALLEPLIQDALPWADGQERETEGPQQRAQILSWQQSHSQDQRERFLAIVEEGDQEMMMEDIERTPETISSPRMQMSVKRDHGLQTIASITFEEESQTDKINYREKLSQTNEEPRFDTEAQTDNPKTRDRKLQTDEYVMESDSQTFSVFSQRSNAYAQTVNKVSSDTDVQTEILEQSTNQTQTKIKSYQENEFQTDKVETLDVNSQTNEQSLFHPAIIEKLALKMIELYNNEKTKQDVGDLLPLLETTWKSIQVKIILKSIEKQLGMEIQPKEQNLSAFISRVDEVYEIGKQYASENNFIHAVISFFAAANLHRIANKNNNSVNGIHNCVLQVRLVVEKMANQPGAKVIVIDHVIPLMHEMKDYVQFIKSSSRDIKVVREVWCSSHIGACYYYCDEYQQCANINEYAIELLKKQFNDEAAKHRVYANCLRSAGLAYYYLGEIEKSIEKYKMSLKAHGEANDWSSDKVKTDHIAETENNLKIAEAKLRKQTSLQRQKT